MPTAAQTTALAAARITMIRITGKGTPFSREHGVNRMVVYPAWLELRGGELEGHIYRGTDKKDSSDELPEAPRPLPAPCPGDFQYSTRHELPTTCMPTRPDSRP